MNSTKIASISIKVTALIMMILFVGCSSNYRIGNFTASFVDRMLAHGARLSNTNGLPRIVAPWFFVKTPMVFSTKFMVLNLQRLNIW